MVHPALTNRADPNWDEARELNAYAQDAMGENDFAKAIELLQKSAGLDPRYKTLFLLGECLFHERRLNEAVVAYAAATTLNRSGIAPAHLAELWFELGSFARARDMIELALERQPHYNRAQAFKAKLEKAVSERDAEGS